MVNQLECCAVQILAKLQGCQIPEISAEPNELSSIKTNLPQISAEPNKLLVLKQIWMGIRLYFLESPENIEVCQNI